MSHHNTRQGREWAVLYMYSSLTDKNSHLRHRFKMIYLSRKTLEKNWLLSNFGLLLSTEKPYLLRNNKVRYALGLTSDDKWTPGTHLGVLSKRSYIWVFISIYVRVCARDRSYPLTDFVHVFIFLGVVQNGKSITQFKNTLKQSSGLFSTDMSWFYPKWTCKCALLANRVDHYLTLVKYNINCWLFLSQSHPSYQLWRVQTFNTSS